MNIERVLFDRIISNLEEVLDTVPPLHPDIQQEVDLFARDFVQKVIVDFYNCPDASQKTPEKILGAIFDGAIFMRCIMDDISDDFEARQTVISSIISDYDVWAGGRVEKLIKDDKEYMDYTVTKELAIEETISLTYQEFGIELNEDCALILLTTALMAFCSFCFRIKYELFRNEKVHQMNFSLLGFIKNRLF